MVIIDPINRQRQLDILSNVFDINKEVSSEFEAQKIIIDNIIKLKEENNLENFNITTYIKDNSLIYWKRSRGEKNQFVKIFTNEIEYVKQSQSISRAEISFLYFLTPYLSWCENLLVDKEGIPLNQKALCKELELNRKTVYSNMKTLEEHKCLIRVWDGRDTYYIINPYLMFKGDKINKAIPKLFELIGYKELDKNIDEECLDNKDSGDEEYSNSNDI